MLQEICQTASTEYRRDLEQFIELQVEPSNKAEFQKFYLESITMQLKSPEIFQMLDIISFKELSSKNWNQVKNPEKQEEVETAVLQEEIDLYNEEYSEIKESN